MVTKLTRITELAKQRPRVKLQTLIHAIDEESLKAAHSALSTGKAVGVDAVTKEKIRRKATGKHYRSSSKNEAASI